MFAWWFRIPFWQRVAAGFVLGALVGWAMGPAAGTWLQPLGTLYVNLIRMMVFSDVTFMISLTVSVTLLFAIVLSAAVGCLLPMGAKRLGLDPAVMASPMITTIVDCCALIIYFMVAGVTLGL